MIATCNWLLEGVGGVWSLEMLRNNGPTPKQKSIAISHSWNRTLFELPGTSRRIRQQGPNLKAILVLMAVYASDLHRMLREAGIAVTKLG